MKAIEKELSFREANGYTAIEQQVLETALETASEMPGNERGVWELMANQVAEMNVRLKVDGHPPLNHLSFDQFCQVLAGSVGESSVHWEAGLLQASQATACLKTPPRKGTDMTTRTTKADLQGRPVSLKREDDSMLLVHMGRLINRRKELEAIRERGYDAAPLTLTTGSRADEILGSSVSYARTIPSFAHLVCDTFIDELRDEMQWRFGEASTAAWRKIFIDRFVEEELIAASS